MEQQAVLNLLQLIEQQDAWPTRETRQKLKAQWGQSCSS
jgi:hypothetical protein